MSDGPGALGARLTAAEDLVDRAINRLTEAEPTTVGEACAVAQAIAAVVGARVAYDNRLLGTDQRRPLHVSGYVVNR